jgi:ketosteroid isomerase-like protein
MGAQENLQTAREAYDAYTKGDIAAMVATWAPGVTFHVPGQSVLAGTFRGQDDVLGLLQRLAERSGNTIRLDVHDVVASDEHVVVLCRQSGERNGRTVDMPAAHVWHTDENGKLSEVWFLVEDQGLMDEFWA